MTRARRAKLIATGVVVGVVVLAWYGCVQFNRKMELTFTSPCLFVYTGSMENQAHLMLMGLQDRGLCLFVQPAKENLSSIKYIDDLALYARNWEAIWSLDGSVIAIRSGAKLFVCAYDFQTRKSFTEHSESEPKRLSAAIKQLVESRGGAGKPLPEYEIEARLQRLDWTSWAPYRTAMRVR